MLQYTLNWSFLLLLLLSFCLFFVLFYKDLQLTHKWETPSLPYENACLHFYVYCTASLTCNLLDNTNLIQHVMFNFWYGDALPPYIPRIGDIEVEVLTEAGINEAEMTLVKHIFFLGAEGRSVNNLESFYPAFYFLYIAIVKFLHLIILSLYLKRKTFL